jgi:hypothetical protein
VLSTQHSALLFFSLSTFLNPRYNLDRKKWMKAALMRNRSETRVLLLFLCGVVFALACNLTNAPPTPTAQPVVPTSPNSGAPTLFPSITPLGATGPIGTQPPGSTCNIPVGWVQYTVESGDSLGALAEATQSTVSDIANGNCMADADTLFVGQTIYLPRSPISG